MTFSIQKDRRPDDPNLSFPWPNGSISNTEGSESKVAQDAAEKEMYCSLRRARDLNVCHLAKEASMICPFGMKSCFASCGKRCTAEGYKAHLTNREASEKAKRGRINRKRNVTNSNGAELRSSQGVRRRSHKPEIGGSSPSSAPIFFLREDIAVLSPEEERIADRLDFTGESARIMADLSQYGKGGDL